MKTSNILIATATAIIIGALVAYDFALKAEYLNLKELGIKEYTRINRFNGYDTIKLNDFDIIDLKAANAISVNVEYGEKEAVWIRNDVKEMIEVSQNKNSLIVDLTAKGKNEHYFNFNSIIIIISPRIRKIITEPFEYASKKTKAKQDNVIGFRDGIRTIIENFSQDSLTLNVARSTNIKLQKNKLKYLNASVGDRSGDGNLKITTDNSIESLKLKAFGKSTAEILETDIQNVAYDISDGAIVTFRGNVLNKVLTK